MDIRVEFGMRVKKRRLELGLSQENFAFKTDIHRTYVSGIERGARNPSLTMIQKLAKGLEISMSDLLAIEISC